MPPQACPHGLPSACSAPRGVLLIREDAMRIAIAAIIGAIVMFIWGVAAHVALPIGDMGMKMPVEQDAAISALQASATEGEGVYMIPRFANEKMSDTAFVEAFQEKYKATPYALVIYQPGGNPALQSMAP